MVFKGLYDDSPTPNRGTNTCSGFCNTSLLQNNLDMLLCNLRLKAPGVWDRRRAFLVPSNMGWMLHEWRLWGASARQRFVAPRRCRCSR